MLKGLLRLAVIAGAGYAWRKFRSRNSGQTTYPRDRTSLGSQNTAGGLGFGNSAGTVGTGAGVSGGSSYGTAGSTSSYSTGAGSGAGTGSLAGSGTSGMTGGAGVGSSSIRSDLDTASRDTPLR
jgi:hypothetical protein